MNNQRGQTLVEYLIIVALVGVGSIALMRAVSQNINARFADVVLALGGNVEGGREAAEVSSNMYRKRDMKDFVNGTVNKK
jgi:pilus assembly protein Flp/PilA